MADEIEDTLDVEVEFQKGELHSFDVLVDDELIFSKSEEGRFPEAEEIIELIQAYLGQE